MDHIRTPYTYRLTPYLQNLLRDKPSDHPLARQFMPDERELVTLPHELSDPIADHAHSPVKGIVHRHRDRVLLKIHHACPVYCRFCFRRDMIGHRGDALRENDLDVAIDYIRRHPEIWEVILTGGDPLALSARRLGAVLQQLRAIPHVEILRIHTRVPLVNPDAIDTVLCDTLTDLQRQSAPLYIALHANHPDELTSDTVAAIGRLRRTGAILLSQTVLLRQVNDSAETLEALFRQLVRHGVKPYYLHQLDPAPGTAHFHVPIEVGQGIMRTLRRATSGLCLPTYVVDSTGGDGKVPV